MAIVEVTNLRSKEPLVLKPDAYRFLFHAGLVSGSVVLLFFSGVFAGRMAYTPMNTLAILVSWLAALASIAGCVLVLEISSRLEVAYALGVRDSCENKKGKRVRRKRDAGLVAAQEAADSAVAQASLREDDSDDDNSIA